MWNDITKVPPPERARCIVTNNMAGRDAFGKMSHLWLLHPIYSERFEYWIGFDCADRMIHNISHWHPLPQPVQE